MEEKNFESRPSLTGVVSDDHNTYSVIVYEDSFSFARGVIYCFVNFIGQGPNQKPGNYTKAENVKFCGLSRQRFETIKGKYAARQKNRQNIINRYNGRKERLLKNFLETSAN